MLNGKYPLLLIEIEKVAFPIYLDENVFEIAVQGEDKSIGLTTTKTGTTTTQTVSQNVLNVNLVVSKNSQYGTILFSLLDKIYTSTANIYSKWDNAETFTSKSSLISGIGTQVSGLEYSISYYSDTDSITDAVMTNYTKTSEVGSTNINISLTLEKKPPVVSDQISVKGESTKLGKFDVKKGV